MQFGLLKFQTHIGYVSSFSCWNFTGEMELQLLLPCLCFVKIAMQIRSVHQALKALYTLWSMLSFKEFISSQISFTHKTNFASFITVIMKNYNCFQNVNTTGEDCCSILWWYNVCRCHKFYTRVSLNWQDATQFMSLLDSSNFTCKRISNNLSYHHHQHCHRISVSCCSSHWNKWVRWEQDNNEREEKAIWSWNNMKLLLTKRRNNSSARAHLHRKMTV
jgi:hypothetical protein